MDTTSLKYPNGKFTFPDQVSIEDRTNNLNSIRDFPFHLKEAVSNLSKDQFQLPYRPEGWTIHQVIHHCADSHMNALTRFKWALTEDNPNIKAYNQTAWAELPDTLMGAPEISIKLLEALHQRWVLLLSNLEEADWNKTFYHPEMKKSIRLDQNLCLYGWHCRHHLGHVKQALKYKGNFS